MQVLRILFFSSALLHAFYSFSQSSTSGRTTEKGNWAFSHFDPDIIKATFKPFYYLGKEQVSNAVIAKPSSKKKFATVITDPSGSLHFNSVTTSVSLLNYFDSAGFRGFRFQLSPDEKIFGTGERSIPLNRRGYKLNLYNNPWYGYSVNADNLNYSVPIIISSKGYAIFFDNPSKGYLDIGKRIPDVLEYGASSGELSFYIIPGKNVDEILKKYHSLTGTQPLPPRWAFGNLMSRFGYRSESQLMSILQRMQDDKIPVDAVIIDLFWFGDSIKATMGNLEWVNKKAWPDPEKMISNLKKQNIKTILITEPFILSTTPNYKRSKRFHAVDSTGKPFLLTDFYFGNGGLLDMFRKDAQDWFWNKYQAQIKKGVAGWWGDLGEPEKHPSAIHHSLKDLGFRRLFKADEVHNIYGHYWNKMLFEKYTINYPDVRLFHLQRSGYAGSPRYCVFPWTGDVSRSWEGLRGQLPLMIGMSMSGVPYIHSDAGGFAGGEGDPELYTRWMQFAVFTPILRPHGTALGDLEPSVKDIPSEAALYPEPYQSIVRNYINLRYQLLPYNYTLAYEQAKSGKPLLRPLFYYNATDTTLFKIEDQFMWGGNILVAPVVEKGAAERRIYLPAGRWYDFTSASIHVGGKWITENVNLENIPVFIKEGSFIPMFVLPGEIKTTTQYTGRNITVKYYPSSQQSSYTFFDDDGKSKSSLAKGKYDLITFKGKVNDNVIRIKIFAQKKPLIATRKFRIELPAENEIASVRLNNKPLAKRYYVTNNETKNNFVVVTFSGKEINLDLRLK